MIHRWQRVVFNSFKDSQLVGHRFGQLVLVNMHAWKFNDLRRRSGHARKWRQGRTFGDDCGKGITGFLHLRLANRFELRAFQCRLDFMSNRGVLNVFRTG